MENRVKPNFRISKGTFMYILELLVPCLQRETLAEEPISPDKMLAIFLYRMGRGDYLHTIAELFGVGDATVCQITLEVSNIICQTCMKRGSFFSKL